MGDLIEKAEARAAKFNNVDLRDILRNAFIVEDGLKRFLFNYCQCAFAEHGGMYYLVSTDGIDKGKSLAKDTDFEAILHAAMTRYVAPQSK